MRSRLGIAIVFVMLAVIGCNSGSDISGLDIQDYVPQEFGLYRQENRAVYFILDEDTVSVYHKRLHGQCTELQYNTDHGTLYKWIHFAEAQNSELEFANYAYRSVDNGVYSVYSEDMRMVGRHIEEPIVEGNSWRFSYTPLMGESYDVSYQIVNTDTTISVPAGVFSCIQVNSECVYDAYTGEYSDENYGDYDCDGPETCVKNMWFAPGIGVVKTVTTWTSTNETPYVIVWSIELMERPTDLAGIEALLHEHIACMNTEDIEGVMGTISQRSDQYQSTENLAPELFETYDFDCSLDNLKLVSVDGDEAEIMYQLTVNGQSRNDTPFEDNITLNRQTLIRENGNWKLNHSDIEMYEAL